MPTPTAMRALSKGCARNALMTVSFGEIADALRWFWLALALGWVAYGWLQRVPYPRVLLGLAGLFVLDWLAHALAEFVERPGSDLPSDFSLYSVMLLTAAAVGLAAACLYARWRGLSVTAVLDAALVCVIAGGIGGRAHQVLTNWSFYAENPDLVPDLAHGGLGIRGALLFGFLALLLFARLTGNSFWGLADAAVIGLALASSIGWYGAALTHLHYGISLDAPPATGPLAPLAQMIRAFGYNFVQDLPDAYNLIAFRIPVQLLYAVFYFALFLVMALLAVKKNAADGSPYAERGLLFAVYVLVTAIANFLFGFWRGDETLVWNGLRADQWLDLLFLILGVALVYGRMRSVRSRERAQALKWRNSQSA